MVYIMDVNDVERERHERGMKECWKINQVILAPNEDILRMIIGCVADI